MTADKKRRRDIVAVSYNDDTTCPNLLSQDRNGQEEKKYQITHILPSLIFMYINLGYAAPI